MKTEFRLENPWLSIETSTRWGGVSISSIKSKTTGREWIYTDKHFQKRRSPSISYDEQYFGGFECIFPNDFIHRGGDQNYPDHGYLWTTSFAFVTWEENEEEEWIEFQGEVKALSSVCTIQIVCLKKSPCFYVKFTLFNHGASYPYLFRFHPSFLLQQSSRIHLDGEWISFMDEKSPDFCDFQVPQRKQRYPMITTKDHSFSMEALAQTDYREVFVHTYPTVGKCQIVDEEETLSLEYDSNKMKSIAFYYTNTPQKIAVIEPETGKYAEMKQLITHGEQQILSSGQEIQYELHISIEPKALSLIIETEDLT